MIYSSLYYQMYCLNGNYSLEDIAIFFDSSIRFKEIMRTLEYV